ncbi:unnamed protein product, partial [marine sediment metagenome]
MLAMSESQMVRDSSSRVSVVPGLREHLEDIVICHIAAFPGELPTLLGRRFLRGMYRFYMDRPEGICLVAIDRDTGFVGGVTIGGKPGLRGCYVLKILPLFAATFLYKAFLHRYVRKRLVGCFRNAFQKISRKFRLLAQDSANLS